MWFGRKNNVHMTSWKNLFSWEAPRGRHFLTVNSKQILLTFYCFYSCFRLRIFYFLLFLWVSFFNLLNQLTEVVFGNKFCKYFSKTQSHSVPKSSLNLLDLALTTTKPLKCIWKCVKIVQIQSFFGPYFPVIGLMGKFRPEKNLYSGIFHTKLIFR